MNPLYVAAWAAAAIALAAALFIAARRALLNASRRLDEAIERALNPDDKEADR